MASASSSTTMKAPPKAPASILDFFKAALFLEDPDLPKEARIGKLQFLSVVVGLVGYVALAFCLILFACVTTPLVPVLQSAYAAALKLLTPPESLFKSAYEFQYNGPIVRLTRYLSSQVVSTITRGASTVAAGEMPALHRIVSHRSFVAPL